MPRVSYAFAFNWLWRPAGNNAYKTGKLLPRRLPRAPSKRHCQERLGQWPKSGARFLALPNQGPSFLIPHLANSVLRFLSEKQQWKVHVLWSRCRIRRRVAAAKITGCEMHELSHCKNLTRQDTTTGVLRMYLTTTGALRMSYYLTTTYGVLRMYLTTTSTYIGCYPHVHIEFWLSGPVSSRGHISEFVP